MRPIPGMLGAIADSGDERRRLKLARKGVGDSVWTAGGWTGSGLNGVAGMLSIDEGLVEGSEVCVVVECLLCAGPGGAGAQSPLHGRWN